MSCAELLAVCLLSAERGPAPRRQPLPIFHDVNDGKLSFEEFKNYFADGILSSEELWELFSGIDRCHSENPQRTGETIMFILDCLAQWSSSSQSFGHQCGLTGSLCPALCHGWVYETASKMEQFLTRFLLRETMHQLQSLQTSLECAVDTVEEQAGRERKDIKKSETSVGLRSGRRCGRKGQKNVCLSPTDPYSGMLTTGTAGGWPLGSGEAGFGFGIPGNSVLQQPRTGCIQTVLWKPRGEGDVPRLIDRASLPSPAQGASCPHSVSACKLTDEACFILYEFWQDVTAWRSHLQSSCSKTFQQSIISLLESPELLTTMLFPASWWIMNNN
ncbi:NECA3 protein, partial [Formicarius rufipectus]|nr:NECA3 protein [Formicarius rufipectus]